MIDWQTRRAKPWLRTVALLVALIFIVHDVVWADGGGLVQSLANRNKVDVAVPSSYDWPTRAKLDAVALPEALGEIKKNFQGSRDRIVIHIQDAHANEEAQRNIAGILDYFAKNYGLKLINLEGAEGELFTELFSFFPNKEARKNVADYFLKEARLTGPEYLAIVDRPELNLYGVEDRQIYEENRRAYLDALQYKDRDEKVLADLGKLMDDVSRFVFSDDLRDMLHYRQAFQSGGNELVSYVRHLVETARKENIALYDYPGMHSLLSLIDLEKEIDFDKAEKSIEDLINDLKNVLTREKLSEFLTNTVQFRMKKMKRADYYGYLQVEIQNMQSTQGAGQEELAQKYDEVLRYLKYMRLYDSIDVAIFSEIEALERDIKNKLFRNEEEVQLDRLFRIFEIYQKMFNFTLTKQDADFFYTYRDEFKAETFRNFLVPLLKQHQFSRERSGKWNPGSSRSWRSLPVVSIRPASRPISRKTIILSL